MLGVIYGLKMGRKFFLGAQELPDLDRPQEPPILLRAPKAHWKAGVMGNNDARLQLRPRLYPR